MLVFFLSHSLSRLRRGYIVLTFITVNQIFYFSLSGFRLCRGWCLRWCSAEEVMINKSGTSVRMRHRRRI